MPNFDDWKTTRYSTKGGMSGELLTDPLKAFDCLRHVLLISKLRAYGIELSSLRLLYSYLVQQKQKAWLKNSYNTWSEILFGVPQGFILGSLLFNIYLFNLIFWGCGWQHTISPRSKWDGTYSMKVAKTIPTVNLKNY